MDTIKQITNKIDEQITYSPILLQICVRNESDRELAALAGIQPSPPIELIVKVDDQLLLNLND